MPSPGFEGQSDSSSFILPPSSLLRFFMVSVFAATAAELAKLKPIRRGLLILGRYVVTALACTTLKNNIIAWHNSILIFVLCSLYFDFHSTLNRIIDQAPSSKY
jgi:hypothetical protein